MVSYGMSVAPPAIVGIAEATRAFMPHSSTVSAAARRAGLQTEAIWADLQWMARDLAEHLIVILQVRGWPDPDADKVLVVREAVEQALAGHGTIAEAATLLDAACLSGLERLAADFSNVWSATAQVHVLCPWIDPERFNRLALWYWLQDRALSRTTRGSPIRFVARKLDSHGIITHVYPEATAENTFPSMSDIPIEDPVPYIGSGVAPSGHFAWKPGPSSRDVFPSSTPHEGRSDRPADWARARTWADLAPSPPRSQVGDGGLALMVILLGAAAFALRGR